VKRLSFLILAAGQGKRFGGPKQLAPVGPRDEILIAYTVHDAIRTGFQHIVIVARGEWAEPIEVELTPIVEQLGATLSIVIQPERPRLVPDEPPRAWGTGHAVLSARAALEGPFAVANGDDWYGPSAHRSLAAALGEDATRPDTHFLVTYRIANTLGGTERVTRARCRIREDGSLSQIEELFDVRPSGSRVVGFTEGGDRVTLSPSAPVSTNFWGFQASILEHLEVHFAAFSSDLEANAGREFLLPTVVDGLMEEGSIRVETRPTDERLCGLTRPEDLPNVRARIADLVASGFYPPDLRSG
jgi:MobA-like NTP transferase domain